MPTFTVHAPPPRKGETRSAPERFRFVRDGFHFWAFLFGPLWLLAYRLWLACTLYVLGCVLIGAGLYYLRAAANAQWLVGVLIALLMGFEAPSLRRWKLERGGWKTLGFVVGEDLEAAERRFFAEWAERGGEVPAPAYAPPSRQAAPSGNDVIGLFPEPGGSR